MDDFILIHHDKEYLEQCKDKIAEYLSTISLRLHPKKTNIYRIGKGIKFLRLTFRLVKTGVVVMYVAYKNVKAERKKLRRMVAKAKKEQISKEKVDECYKAWVAHASKGNSYDLLRKMNNYYKHLWED